MNNPTLYTTCKVVKSRILLTDPVAHAAEADRCVYRQCSNVLNCFFRSDFQGEIPDCLLHQSFPAD